MYLEKSMTTATLQHCPAKLVPQPGPKTGSDFIDGRRPLLPRLPLTAAPRRRWEPADSWNRQWRKGPHGSLVKRTSP